MESVILLENMSYTRYRVKELLTYNGIKVYEASNSFEFFNKLYENKDKIKLIILEINLNGEDGLEVMKKIKDRNIDIPVMILTSLNKRTAFIEGVKAGAIDYILKPYENNMFVHRVIKCINLGNKEFEEREKVYLNFEKYINKEINKANENNYKISILLLTFLKSTEMEEKIEIKDEYLILNEVVFKELKELIHKPNILIKRGFSTFIGVFPRSGDKEIKAICKKINEVYKDIKIRDMRLKNYYLENTFVIFPDEANEKQQLFDKLTLKMKDKIQSSNLDFHEIIK